MLNKICTPTPKTRAPVSLRSSGHGIPSLHRDSFLPKVPGFCPVLRQVTQTPHIAGPLGLKQLQHNPTTYEQA